MAPKDPQQIPDNDVSAPAITTPLTTPYPVQGPSIPESLGKPRVAPPPTTTAKPSTGGLTPQQQQLAGLLMPDPSKAQQQQQPPPAGGIEDALALTHSPQPAPGQSQDLTLPSGTTIQQRPVTLPNGLTTHQNSIKTPWESTPTTHAPNASPPRNWPRASPPTPPTVPRNWAATST
ncbi:hypothetical protein ACQPXH_00180 [Nocardia sp. CA-135953]|uniref:hypothetical protein n=1 Tax=Nocardia sp. CA-135953 TaxID=3239978 RepID=UPI003D9867C9